MGKRYKRSPLKTLWEFIEPTLCGNNATFAKIINHFEYVCSKDLQFQKK